MRETAASRQTHSRYLTFTYLLERDIPEALPPHFLYRLKIYFHPEGNTEGPGTASSEPLLPS